MQNSTNSDFIKKHIGIPESRVINKDFLSTLGDIYKCNICFNVMRNPTDCDKCGHSYCLDCISNFSCPYNCESSHPKPSSIAIKILLNQIIFSCQYEGCDMNLSYSNIPLHDQECEFILTKCPTPNCSLNVPKKNLEKHIKSECNFVLEKCKFCQIEFVRNELKEHFENCESIYNSLTGNANSTNSFYSNLNEKSNLALKSNKYIEALNLNIAKILKENEIKYKNLEEENSKIKIEINQNVQSFWEKIKGELHINSKKEDSLDNNKHIEFDETKFKIILNEALTTNFNQILLVKIRELFNFNNNFIQDKLDSFQNQNGFDSIPNQFSNQNFNQNSNQDENENKFNEEEFMNIIKEVLRMNEEKINSCLDDKNLNLVKEIENKFDSMKNHIIDLTINNNQTGTISENKILNEKIEILITDIKELFTNNFSEILIKIEELKKISLDYKLKQDLSISNDDSNKNNQNNYNEDTIRNLTNNFIKNVIEIVEDKYENINEIIKEEIKEANKTTEDKLTKLAEDVDLIKNDIESLNKNTRNLSKIVTEEISEVVNIINEEKDRSINKDKEIKKEYKCECERSLIKIEEMMNKVIEDKLEINKNNKILENNINNEELLHDKNIHIENRLNELESRLISNLDNKLKEMYNLKWCNECEKVDYFFGFIKCLICKKENCKQCVLLCKNCKTLYCKKCVECPKCGEFSCLNCRISCKFCSVSKGDKFCKNCIMECQHCKKETCQECIKQCISCRNMSCSDCSKFCRICNKSSCIKCETSKNFKTCYYCTETSCVECIVTCTMCEMEICKTCFILCKRCNNLICKKCDTECGSCIDSYCGNCAKEFQQNKCNLCKKVYCTGCIKIFRKCKVCKESACKECHSQCTKCKNYFCNNCSLNCDNCNVSTCHNCVYKCVCDNVIFCEKCLLDVHPIGPHNCVLWMNDSPDFKGIKSRSKNPLPKNFEAKLYLEKFDSGNLLIGLTDNNTFDEDSVSFVDNIWAFKIKTGQKYSSQKSLEPYYDRSSREKDFIIVAVKNGNLYFRVNFDENPPAFTLPTNREFYLYVENDGNLMTNAKVKFVYIRKI